jgi:hypothetical protein
MKELRAKEGLAVKQVASGLQRFGRERNNCMQNSDMSCSGRHVSLVAHVHHV